MISDFHQGKPPFHPSSLSKSNDQSKASSSSMPRILLPPFPTKRICHHSLPSFIIPLFIFLSILPSLFPIFKTPHPAPPAEQTPPKKEHQKLTQHRSAAPPGPSRSGTRRSCISNFIRPIRRRFTAHNRFCTAGW